MPFCESCGNALGDAARFCQACGKPVTASPGPLRIARGGLPRRVVPIAILLAAAVIVAVIVLVSIGNQAPALYVSGDGIYLLSGSSAEPKRIASESDVQLALASPNGRWVAYLVYSEDRQELVLCDRRGKILKRSDSGHRYYSPSWAPNSTGVAVLRAKESDTAFGSESELVVFDVKRESEPEVLSSGSQNPQRFQYSPDGRRIVYQNSDGEVMVVDARGKEAAERVSERGSERGGLGSVQPAWLSSKEVAFADRDGGLVAYSVDNRRKRELLSKSGAARVFGLGELAVRVRKKDLVAFMLSGGADYSEQLQMEMEGGEDAHYFRLPMAEDRSYAVVASGDEVRLDIVTESNKALASGAWDDESRMATATYYNAKRQVAYARVRRPASGGTVAYRLMAVCDRESEGGSADESSGDRLVKQGTIPDDTTYRFQGRGGGQVTIDAVSSDFDTVLRLYKGETTNGSPIGMNDDGGGGRNSRLSTVLPRSGWYTAEVSAYGSASPFSLARRGSFTLTVSGPGSRSNPATKEDAWLLSAHCAGLWAAAAPLEDIGEKPVRSHLLAAAFSQATYMMMSPDGSKVAMALTPTVPGREDNEAKLAVMQAGSAPRLLPLDALGDKLNSVSVCGWQANNAGVYLMVNDDEGDTGESLWLVPIGRPEKAKRITTGVRSFSPGGSVQGWLR